MRLDTLCVRRRHKAAHRLREVFGRLAGLSQPCGNFVPRRGEQFRFQTVQQCRQVLFRIPISRRALCHGARFRVANAAGSSARSNARRMRRRALSYSTSDSPCSTRMSSADFPFASPEMISSATLSPANRR